MRVCLRLIGRYTRDTGALVDEVTNEVTGLTVGTAYWVDVGLAAITGGTASIATVSVSALEL